MFIYNLFIHNLKQNHHNSYSSIKHIFFWIKKNSSLVFVRLTQQLIFRLHSIIHLQNRVRIFDGKQNSLLILQNDITI
jgi:hypothetical protein